jgi:hypothetical protein
MIVAGCIFLTGSAARAQQTHDLFQMKLSDRADLVLEAMKEATTAVSAVKDKQTAEVAKSVLESVDKRIKLYSEREAERTPAERRWVADFFIPRKEAQQAELEKAYDKVLAVDPKLLPLFLDSSTLKTYRGNVIKRTKSMAQTIQTACKAYYVTTGKWPTKLEELANPPDGSKPWVGGGKNGVKDPSGKDFSLKFEKDQFGLETPVISTVNPFGDGKEVIRYPEKAK